jgi:hypothetical protein
MSRQPSTRRAPPSCSYLNDDRVDGCSSGSVPQGVRGNDAPAARHPSLHRYRQRSAETFRLDEGPQTKSSKNYEATAHELLTQDTRSRSPHASTTVAFSAADGGGERIDLRTERVLDLRSGQLQEESNGNARLALSATSARKCAVSCLAGEAASFTTPDEGDDERRHVADVALVPHVRREAVESVCEAIFVEPALRAHGPALMLVRRRIL